MPSKVVSTYAIQNKSGRALDPAANLQDTLYGYNSEVNEPK
jgi:hypothetical protein